MLPLTAGGHSLGWRLDSHNRLLSTGLHRFGLL